jgi:DNA polymerase-3 subunit delta'
MLVTLVPLYGHDDLRRRLAETARRGTLPASLLLQGPAGVGKQRLALWLGQLLLCTGDSPPCGKCQACRYATALAHPDLVWVFPIARPRDGEPTDDDRTGAIAERLTNSGLYASPSGSEAIFVSMVRSLLRVAAMAPALGRRKIIVVGDAERMVPQEGAEAAANAFLKLLEEPPADTTLILTSSVPGSLLPTIRSRVVAVRVPYLTDDAVRAFVGDSAVAAALREVDQTGDVESLVRLAGGAPGTLFARADAAVAQARADRLIEVALRGRTPDRYALALASGAAKARATFSDTLDGLTANVHRRARAAVQDAQPGRARALATAVDAINRSATLAAGNVNPQLIAASLLARMAETLRE